MMALLVMPKVRILFDNLEQLYKQKQLSSAMQDPSFQWHLRYLFLILIVPVVRKLCVNSQQPLENNLVSESFDMKQMSYHYFKHCIQ